MRAEAGILYVLHQLSEDGHICYPYEPLIEECKKILGVGRDTITSALGKAVSEKKIIIEDSSAEWETDAGTKAVYLAKFHVSEVGVACMLKNLMLSPRGSDNFDRDKAIEWVQRDLNLRLAELQKQTVREALDKKVMVVTGGPGTGKTTVINAFIRIYKRYGQRVLLAAPTGRAAKRMTEATGHEAKTIHGCLSSVRKKADLNGMSRIHWIQH